MECESRDRWILERDGKMSFGFDRKLALKLFVSIIPRGFILKRDERKADIFRLKGKFAWLALEK
jgi:hypothetical protein